jgi:isoquinoline 1-oxidoreductase beta subunit
LIEIVNLSRRRAMTALAGGAGLALGVYWPAARAAPKSSSLPAGNEDAMLAPNIFLFIDGAGTVNVTVSRSEMGQGIRMATTMIVADELAASWPRMVVRQADADPRYGDQDTDASRSIRLMYKPLRLAAAAARTMLEAAAAQLWRTSIADCRAVDHEVIHVPTGRFIGFAQLVKTAAALPVPNPDKLRLEDRSSRRYVGHAMTNIDLRAMISGKTLYGADVTLPGLKYASIERCPVYGGKVKSFQPAGAMAVRGVEQVIEIPAPAFPPGNFPLGGVAVIASNSWAAFEGRRKLEIEWDLGPNATHDSAAYRTELEAAVRRPGRTVRSQGNFDTAFSGAATRLSAEYFVPYQPHATMEPPAAAAVFENGRLSVMAPTQSPQGARATLAQYLDLKESDISVRPSFLGNGFGRKAMHDYVCEAAWLAKTLGGRVKLAWSREDDIRHGYYLPMVMQRLDGGIDKNGMPIAWRHRTVFSSLNSTFHADQILPDAAQLATGVTDMPYSIANIRCEVGAVQPHMRLGSGRGGLSIAHAFATSSFIDELAAAAGKDAGNYLFNYFAGPRKIDLRAIGVDYPNYGASIEEFPIDVARLQNVLQFAMDRAGWTDPLLPRQGRGLAVHRSYLSYVAAVVVVAVAADGAISVPRVDVAIDCGDVIYPDRVRALMEDSVMYGLGFALYGGVTVKHGAVEEGNLDAVRLARMDLTPEIRVHIVPSAQPPSGAGDPGVPVIAPALCNAIFAATGKRIRSLPIDSSQLKDTAPAPQPVAAPTSDVPGIEPTPTVSPPAIPAPADPTPPG